jgi:uncharacterized protein YbaP (TraB family)
LRLTRLPSTALAAACVFIATAIAPATAQQPAASPQPSAAGKGLPMWVIRDADSVVYLTGTIHILPNDVNWRSDRLEAALKEASEVWFELAEFAAPGGLNAAILSAYEDKLTWDGPPLSSLLTEDEAVLLKAAMKRAKMPREMAARIETMKPWYAVYAMGRGHDVGGDYDENNGIDRALASLAIANGSKIKGLETLEFQVSDIFDMDVPSQLDELRARLVTDTAMKDRSTRVADLAYISWARGETNLIEAMATMMRGTVGTDALLKNRNEEWSAQIEDLLKGSGTSFIAVGALHLAGPDSLFQRLKLRGINAERY